MILIELKARVAECGALIECRQRFWVRLNLPDTIRE